MRRSLLCPLVALCACGGSPAPRDITGPFTGATYRFVVDQMVLPMQRSDDADDLNGDGRVDDQLGNIAGALGGDQDLTGATDDLMASGALTSVVEITTDDPSLRNDPTVGVRFIGADGEPADEMGAALVDGVLTSNVTRFTHTPASATVHLPLLERADPLALPAIGLEVRLAADGSGFGGTLNGAFVVPSDVQPAWAGVAQMIASNPQEFPFLITILDANQDGAVSLDEFVHAGFIENLLAPDVQLSDGNGHWSPTRDNTHKDALSFGLWIHLSPCASGRCHAPPAQTCDDRIRDGDESDVDCGGSCLACPGNAHCNGDGDCQSRRCAAGVCAPPSCSDGIRDGSESGVDCGWECPACPSASQCHDDRDCVTGYCANAFLSLGTCTATLCHDGVKDNDESDVDCGGHCPGCGSGKRCLTDGDCASQTCSGGICA